MTMTIKNLSFYKSFCKSLIDVDTANQVSESLVRDSDPGVFPKFRDPL